MKKGVTKVLSLITTVMVIALLLSSAPANAFTLEIDSTESFVKMGETTDFNISTVIGDGEKLQIDKFIVDIVGPETISCEFLPNGTLISNCSGIKITPIFDTTSDANKKIISPFGQIGIETLADSMNSENSTNDYIWSSLGPGESPRAATTVKTGVTIMTGSANITVDQINVVGGATRAYIYENDSVTQIVNSSDCNEAGYCSISPPVPLEANHEYIVVGDADGGMYTPWSKITPVPQTFLGFTMVDTIDNSANPSGFGSHTNGEIFTVEGLHYTGVAVNNGNDGDGSGYGYGNGGDGYGYGYEGDGSGYGYGNGGYGYGYGYEYNYGYNFGKGILSYKVSFDTDHHKSGIYHASFKLISGNKEYEKGGKTIYLLDDKLRGCSMRAQGGDLSEDTTNYTSERNGLSFNIPLKNAVSGSGSVLSQAGRTRLTYDFEVLGVLEDNNSTLQVLIKGNYRLNRENKTEEKLGVILLDKNSKELSIASKGIQILNMKVGFNTKSCKF